MSLNQSRAEKNEASQYRRVGGRPGSSGHPRNFAGGSGKGGGGGTAPPSSSSTNSSSSSSSLASNRSFKKSNNVQGAQSRVSGASVNSDSNNAPAARTVQNGAHLPLHGETDAPTTAVVKTTDIPAQKSSRAVPKAPSSHTVTTYSDSTMPATPTKGPEAVPLQFGSISPGFMNEMQIPQIPARTSSAPPNLDEQKRDQARHDSIRGMPSLPIPSSSKQKLPKKDAADADQANTGEAHPLPRAKRDVQVPSAPSVTQTQKPSGHSVSGISMQMRYNQPQIPIQFGGPNTPIHSQGMSATSLPLPMPIPIQMGNPQIQQQLFVPSLQPLQMQAQGIIHHSQGMNFTSQMSPQLPPQLGTLGYNVTPQFPQQQAGRYVGPRKVKITHPDTHEELRLDKRTDMHVDSGSSVQRSHPNVPPQSQPIPSLPPANPMNYYPNSYNGSTLFFPAPSSLPLTSTQINSNSQAQIFNYPVSQGPQTASLVSQSAINSFSVNKTGTPSHGIAEPSKLEHTHDVHNVIPSTSSASVQVTVKPASGTRVDNVADLSLSVSSPAVESPKSQRPHGEASSIFPPRDSEASSRSFSLQSKPGLGATTAPLHVERKQSTAVPASVSVESLAANSPSSTPTALEESTLDVTSGSEGRRNEITSRSDSFKDQPKKQPGRKGHSLPQHEVCGLPTSVSSLSYSSFEQTGYSDSRTPETVEVKTSFTPSGVTVVTLETTSESPLTAKIATSDASDSKNGSAGSGSTCESIESIDGAGMVVDALGTCDQKQQGHSSLQDGRPKLETVETKEKGETMMPKGAKRDENSVKQTDQSLVPKLTTHNEIRSLETARTELAEPPGCCNDDEKVADIPLVSTSTALDAINGETSSATITNASNSCNTLTSVGSLSGGNSMDRKEVINDSGSLDQDQGSVSTSLLPEVTVKGEVEGTGSISSGLVSELASGQKDKPMLESNRAKTAMTKSKKKRREILKNADAAGTTSDLYMAYKGPEEKKGTVVSSESTSSSNMMQVPVDTSQEDVASIDINEQSKSEPDDWEDAADMSTPKLETTDNEKQVHEGIKHSGGDRNGVAAKKYSRDFLLKFSEQCIDLPKGFVDRSEALLISSESFPSPGRIHDRPTGGPRPDRRGRGMGDDDKWNKSSGALAPGRDLRLDISYVGNSVGLRPGQGGNFGVLRNPGVQIPVQYAGGILSGPVQSLGSQGGMQRNSPDSDRWQRVNSFHKGLIPPPQTPLQVMHKAERKYQVGKVTDEEQSKQRQLKAILNKLTPQNFDKLFEQVKAVNIDNVSTLTGVISQIFDKALMEPTFCEMYANFCFHLAGELPDFSEENEKITFKRLLLNKCQEEFERGEREEQEANRAEEEGEVKQSEEEREEKRIQARRRMLGNIRLIGELYKKRMLTERIMHECITKLLGQYQNPDEEDVEALCKLMSTIGEMIDHPRAKEYMDAYFDGMEKLSNNMKLSSRVRFMLKDAIDLRKNKWQQRRKVEGPKKIEEVHRDAAQERQAQTSRLVRGSSINSSVRRGQPVDFGPRGSNMSFSPNSQPGNFRGLPAQLRSYGAQDVRLDNRHSFDNRTPSVPLPQRPIGDDSITLGPQGGLARGMSFRGQPSMQSSPLTDSQSHAESKRLSSGPNGYDQPNTQERSVNFGNRDLRSADHGLDRSRPLSPPTKGQEPGLTQNVPSEKVWAEERLREKSLAAIKEFYSAKDEKELILCVKDLNAPSFYPSMISVWVTDSFERKAMERDLLAELLVNLAKSQEIVLSRDSLIKGFESVLTNLEDAVNDAPKAPEFLGHIFAKVILENLIPFREIAQIIYEGGEDRGRLVEIGLAAEVVVSMLETIKSEGGEATLNEIRTSSSLRLEKFRPPDPNQSRRLDKFIQG